MIHFLNKSSVGTSFNDISSTDISLLQDGNYTNFNGSADILPEIYYSEVYRVMSVLLNVLIFVIGMVGNILVVIVVLGTRTMRTPTNCYLMSLAFADILVLLSATLPAIPETFFQINQWPFGRVLCSLLVFMQYVGVDVSAMSITAFTMERYIAICHPMKAQAMCTVNRAKRIIIGIWVFGVLYCSPWLGLTILVKQKNMKSVVDICTVRLKREHYLAYYMTDLIVFYVIPLIIAAVLYGLIARMLFMTTIPNVVEDTVKINGYSKSRKRSSSRMQVVRMLSVIVVVFATTWLPYRTMVVYNSIAKERYLDLWFLLFCRTMIYINSAINPILYNAMSIKFRRAFKRILCCGPASERQNTLLLRSSGAHTYDTQISVYSEMHPENAMILSRRLTNAESKFISSKRPSTTRSINYQVHN